MTNLLELLRVSAAYHAAAAQLMVGEANWVAGHLELDQPLPLNSDHLVEAIVMPPQFGIAGSLRSSNYLFGFWQGRLHSVARTGPASDGLDVQSDLLAMARQPSLIDATRAYQLSTQWLATLEVDVLALERRFRPSVVQRSVITNSFAFRPGERSPPPLKLPIFDVRWGDPFRRRTDLASVEVTVLGTTARVLEIRTQDLSFGRRIIGPIPDADQLNSLPGKVPLPATASDLLTKKSLSSHLGRPTAEAFLNAEPIVRLREWLGGSEGLDILRQPDRIFFSRIPQKISADIKNLDTWPSPPQLSEIPAGWRSKVSEPFLEPQNYAWNKSIGFWPTYSWRVQFEKGTNRLDFFLDPRQQEVCRYRNGREPRELRFDYGHRTVIEILEQLPAGVTR